MYYVVAPDGSQYGPADYATLRQWVGEGRVLPATVLVDATTNQKLQASSVPNLFRGHPGNAATGAMPTTGYHTPYATPGVSPYHQPQDGVGSSGVHWINMVSLVISIVAFLCMPLSGALAVLLGIVGQKYPGKSFGTVGIVIGSLAVAYGILIMVVISGMK
ncbi:MAG: hypothetical protein JST35_08210 [Armatimonadetes bacterium]|nr:hypothetical protein [Armatimonadota bacterium]